MGIFGRSRKPEHRAGVMYVYDRRDSAPPYYGAACTCGWSTEPVIAGYPDPDVEQQMASAAQGHDPAADTSVGFPMDKPPGA
jgi:hypothetical protein